MAETAAGIREAPVSRSRVQRRARGRRRMLSGVVGGALAVTMVGGLLAARRGSPPADGLMTAPVERGDLVQTVSATGSVTAQTGAMVKIGAQITGRIAHLYADVGSRMRAGQLIAELDVPELRAQVQQAEATLALSQKRVDEQRAGVGLQSTQAATDIQRAQAAVAAARANLNQAQQTAAMQVAAAEAQVRQAQASASNAATSLKRQEGLFAEGYVAVADVDSARAQAEVDAAQLTSAQQNLALTKTKVATDVDSAREALRQAQATATAAHAGTAQNAVKQAQVAAAQETVRQSAAQLALARANLDKAYIRTPISGTVLQLAQQEGETIAAGLSAPTLIIVADLNRLQVEAYVDETDIGKVRIGQRAEVTVDAYPDRTFPGVVAKIASGSTTQQNVVTYDVTIALRDPRGALKPDMTATVSIEVARRSSALTVPVDAVKQGAGGTTVTVMRPTPDGRPQSQTVAVRTGISDDEKTEVLEGVQEGDLVVLAGAAPNSGQQPDRGPRMGGPFGLGPPGGRGGGRGR